MSTVDRGPPREQTARVYDAHACVVYVVGRCRMRMRVRRVRAGDTITKHHIFDGALPRNKEMSGTSGKKHFYEMKGEVGMSWHEKERQQEVAYTKTESNS